MLCLHYLRAMRLGQAIDVVVLGRGYSEVLREVDNLHILGYAVLLEKCCALAVSEAEKHHIYGIERHIAAEGHLGFAYQTFVHFIHLISGVALRVGKHYLHLGVIEQHAYEFAAGIAGGSQYSYFYHSIAGISVAHRGEPNNRHEALCWSP